MAINKTRYYSLFEVTGIELEYMIVDRDNLSVKPVADKIFFDIAGEFNSDHTNGSIEWSNELALHVIELKSTEPSVDINSLPKQFTKNVEEINGILLSHNAMLLPTAAHPFMNPIFETKLWPHENREIYRLYNEVFNCSSHGWGNLQSMHLNLPFKNDREFEKLHAAIRILLPVIPAISASSPIIDGKFTGYKDTRLREYLVHQNKIPVLSGSLIPERIYTEEDYKTEILNPIEKAFKPLDKNSIMNPLFLNSRGAIARFDRGAIEIRVIDMQESPASDVSIASVIIEALKCLVFEEWSSTEYQKKWHEMYLLDIFKSVIISGENTIIADPEYLKVFNINYSKISAGDLWNVLYERVSSGLNIDTNKNFSIILNSGSLSSRIQSRIGEEITMESIVETYKELSDCLKSNRMFI